MKKFLLILGLLILFSPAGIVIADDHTEGEVPTPAIVVEEPPEQIEDVAWTYRFLIPTTVAIATLVILGNVIQYFRQVTRKRYKVIEKLKIFLYDRY